MNLLEQYIVEVHSVEPYTEEWTKKFPDREFLEVDMTTTSYGRDKREKHVFNTKEWAEISYQGYYWA